MVEVNMEVVGKATVPSIFAVVVINIPWLVSTSSMESDGACDYSQSISLLPLLNQPHFRSGRELKLLKLC